MKKIVITSLTICLSIITLAQNTDNRQHLDSIAAEKLIDIAVENGENHNVVNDVNKLIDTEEKAIVLAEFYLITIYGKKEIIKQKPYDIFLLNNCWLISGTLKKGYKGGTFLIIIDSTNGTVLQITHGK